MKIQITKGKVKRAVRTVLYGVAGVGKSTFASNIPDALFIDTESGTDSMDVARLPKPESWSDLQEELDFVLKEKPCSTLVVDTIDRIENLLIQDTVKQNGKQSIEDYGYGKGYVMIQERWQKEFLFRLDKIIAAGINVVLVAHSISRKVETPEESAYDHWELNLSRKVAPVTRDWTDMMLFCNYDLNIVDTSNGNGIEKRKAVGNIKRKIFCNQKPQFDAKNRFGLADSYDLSFEPFRRIFEGKVERQDEKVLLDLNAEVNGIVEDVNDFKDSLQESLVKELDKKGITQEELENWMASTGRGNLEVASDLMLKQMLDNIDVLVNQICAD